MILPNNKPRPFLEKIADVKLAVAGTGSSIASKNEFDFLPATLSLVCQLDFLSIKPDTDYILYVFVAHKPVENFTTTHATRVNITKEKTQPTEGGYVMAQGSLTFDLPIMETGPYVLAFELRDSENNPLDIFYRYLYFTKAQ